MNQAKGEERKQQRRTGVGWMFRPLETLEGSVRWVYVGLLTCIGAALSGLLQRRMESPFGVPDHEYYVSMANGQGASVPQPFASRPLAPLLARGIAALGHWPVEQGFVVLGWISLLVMMVVVFALAMRSAAPRWLPLAIALTPFWPELLHALAMPDLLAAAMLCGFLLCLEANRPMLAAVALCPLMVGRESTSLVLVSLLLVSWRQLRWIGCAIAVGAVAAGSIIVRGISAGAAGNTEHIPAAMYLVAKVPWNLVRLVGIMPWSNLYPYLCTVPALQMTLPLGRLRSLGVCTVWSIPPQSAAMALLTTFGLLPVLGVLLWRALGANRRFDPLTRFCLVYGGFSCVLAPLIGTAYSRLFGYAWPLFFVALPRLFPAVHVAERTKATPDGTADARVPPAAASSGPWLATGGLWLVHLGLGTLVYFNGLPSFLLWEGGLALLGALLLFFRRSGLLHAMDSVSG